jgi:hypothetical protein
MAVGNLVVRRIAVVAYMVVLARHIEVDSWEVDRMLEHYYTAVLQVVGMAFEHHRLPLEVLMVLHLLGCILEHLVC